MTHIKKKQLQQQQQNKNNTLLQQQQLQQNRSRIKRTRYKKKLNYKIEILKNFINQLTFIGFSLLCI